MRARLHRDAKLAIFGAMQVNTLVLYVLGSLPLAGLLLRPAR